MNIFVFEHFDLVLLGAYLLFTLFLGWQSGKDIKTFKEFALDKSGFSPAVLGMTMCATLIGGGSSLGTATEVFKFGIIVIFAKYGVSVGAIIIAYILAPRIKRFKGRISVGDIMGEMYGSHVRIITGISGALLCIGRVSAQIMSLGFIMNFLFAVPEEVGIFLGGSIIIAYSFFGGIRSVVFTDVVQFFALAIAIPIVLNVSLKWVGGYSGLYNALPKSYISIFSDGNNFVKYLMVFLYMSIPMMTPPFVQRILMAKTINDAKTSFIFMAISDCAFTTVAGMIGLIAYVYDPGFAANGVFLNLLNHLDVFIKGIAVIGMFSVIMSTADSYLNTTSISIIHDILVPAFGEIQERNKLKLVRIFTVFVGVGAILMATRFDNVFELAIYSSNFWGPIVVGPLIVGLLNIKISSKACIISMLLGVSSFLIWEFYNLKDITNIYSIIPAIFVNISVALFSKLLIEYVKK